MQTSGFSDQVQLGDFARRLDQRVVMRIESDRPGESAAVFRRRIAGRYWRGLARAYFNGSGWRRLPTACLLRAPAGGDMRLSMRDGTAIAVYREASDHAYLHLPDGIRSLRHLPATARLDAGGALAFVHAPARRLRLQMRIGPALSDPDLPGMRPPAPHERRIDHIPPALSRWAQRAAGAATARCSRQRWHWRRAISVSHPRLSTATTAATGMSRADSC
jgi:hypothetical protein